jgi:hypothetical protein
MVPAIFKTIGPFPSVSALGAPIEKPALGDWDDDGISFAVGL